MANETTPSTVSTVSLSYVLGQRALPANLPDLVLNALANDMDAAGEASGTVQLGNEQHLIKASPGSYGTQIATNTPLAYDSATSATIVEGALIGAVLLDTAVERTYPGMTGVEMLLQDGSFQQKLALLQPWVNRLTAACLETYEYDHCQLTTGLSTSAGTSASALTVADALSAIYTFDTNEPITRERIWFAWPVQTRDLRADLLVNGGGLGGHAWERVDTAFLDMAQLPKTGVQGSFLGIPYYQGSHSLRTLSDGNANVNGGLLALGRGDPRTGGQLGAFGHARSGFVKVRLQYSPRDRGMIIVVCIEYVALEMRDSLGVRIRSNAT